MSKLRYIFWVFELMASKQADVSADQKLVAHTYLNKTTLTEQEPKRQSTQNSHSQQVSNVDMGFQSHKIRAIYIRYF